jgi:hypothetical protein
MSRNKILRDHLASIKYPKSHWDLLDSKRYNASKLLEIFWKFNPFVYGSIARGDIHPNSDIDIIFIEPIAPFQIEFLLAKNGYEHYFREIIMATPKDSIKLYIYLSDLETITIPITKLDKKSLEFYDFGGKLSLEQLKQNLRVPGVDKRLVFIEPTPIGHNELSLINNESIVAKKLGIHIETVKERKKVLLKREKFGRTGVFLKREIKITETTEGVLKKLADKKSIIRKKLYRK